MKTLHDSGNAIVFRIITEIQGSSGINFVRRAKRTVAVRPDSDDIKSVEKIGERKGLSYASLLRMWIKEHLDKEERVGQDA